MSVLIKDMGKHKSCYAVIDGESEFCPFVNTDDDCVLLLKKGICEGTWADQYSKCPLVEEPERKKGKWIPDEIAAYDMPKGEPRGWVPWLCSECGWCVGKHQTAFCPSCGADMRGEQDDSI